jgi:hypothetical protein
MAMSHIPADVLEQLQSIAFEMREVFEERGYRVDTALDLDPAFKKSGWSRSTLSRDLVGEGFRTGASRVGVDLDTRGGVNQFRVEVGGGIWLFRLKRAHASADAYRIVTNSSSTWGEIDENTLVVETPWVFAYELEAGVIEDIFVAHVLEVVEGNPGHLVLGTPTYLGSHDGPNGRGFKPDTSEALPGLDDDLDFGLQNDVA